MSKLPYPTAKHASNAGKHVFPLDNVKENTAYETENNL